MKDLVIKPEQMQSLMNYLQDQPHKFAAPVIGFFSQIMADQEKQTEVVEKIQAEQVDE